MPQMISNGGDFLIEKSALEKLYDYETVDEKMLELVAPKRSDRFLSDVTGIRNNTAIIDIYGPIFRYTNSWVQLGYGSSLDMIAKDIRTAVESNDIATIILNIDSPGGEVAGVSDLADYIFSQKGNKKIIAYAESLCCSGAYFLAAACSEIVIGEMAQVGSIGVVTSYSKSTNDNRIDFVSSNAPNKRLDPDSDLGKAKIMERLDVLASIFVDKVASYRQISPDELIVAGDNGGIRTGSNAVKHKLADRIGKFEELILALQINNFNGGVKIMNEPETASIDIKKISDDATSKERERILALDNLSIIGAEQLISEAKATGATAGETAIKIVDFLRAQKTLESKKVEASLNVTPISTDEALSVNETAKTKGLSAAEQYNRGRK